MIGTGHGSGRGRVGRWLVAAALAAAGLTGFSGCSQFQEGDCVTLGGNGREVEEVDCDSEDAEYEVGCSGDTLSDDEVYVELTNGESHCLTELP